MAVFKIWGGFVIGYFLFNAVEALLKKRLGYLVEQYIWILRPVLVVLLFVSFAPLIDTPVKHDVPKVKFLPLFIVVLESLIYMAVMYIIQQQEIYYRSHLQAHQTELQMLKMQSNPHFLFNTLNLIATEVTRHPAKAKELIYDLSDLLRNTVRLAKHPWALMEDELLLVELYLVLQQKRFEDRLTFDIDCPSFLNKKKVPSLLLLPIVENAIKHGIAPYAKQGHVGVTVEWVNGYFNIEVQDTGDAFNDQDIQYGEGMRILAETLRLHFGNNFIVSLSSSEEGAAMEICFPEVPSAEHNEGQA